MLHTHYPQFLIKVTLTEKFSLQYNDYFEIAIDSSGIKVTNKREWIRHKWKVKRGYLKMHIAVNTN